MLNESLQQQHHHLYGELVTRQNPLKTVSSQLLCQCSVPMPANIPFSSGVTQKTAKVPFAPSPVTRTSLILHFGMIRMGILRIWRSSRGAGDQTFRVCKLDQELQRLCTQNTIETESGEIAMEYHQKNTTTQPSCSLQHEFSIISFPSEFFVRIFMKFQNFFIFRHSWCPKVRTRSR